MLFLRFCLVAAVMAVAVRGQCAANCASIDTGYVKCMLNWANNSAGDTDVLCGCIDTYANCLNGCDGWCSEDLGGLQATLDGYQQTYCTGEGWPCFNAWCNLITDCANEGGDEGGSGTVEEYYEAVLCYYRNATCNFATLLGELTTAAGATVSFLDDQCDLYENYCEDIGAYGSTPVRRGVTSQRASIKFNAVAFGEQTPEESFNAVVAAVGKGDISGAQTVQQLGCDNCGNKCKDCSISGYWHKTSDGDCEDYFACPSGQGLSNTDMRLVTQYVGTNEAGTTQDLQLTQYWDFGLGRQCTGKWSATYRFYSDASQCGTNVDIDVGTCVADCDLIASDFEDMVCDTRNIRAYVPEGYHDDTIFASGCGKFSLDGHEYFAGTGSSAGVVLPSLFALVAVCAFALVF